MTSRPPFNFLHRPPQNTPVDPRMGQFFPDPPLVAQPSPQPAPGNDKPVLMTPMPIPRLLPPPPPTPAPRERRRHSTNSTPVVIQQNKNKNKKQRYVPKLEIDKSILHYADLFKIYSEYGRVRGKLWSSIAKSVIEHAEKIFGETNEWEKMKVSLNEKAIKHRYRKMSQLWEKRDRKLDPSLVVLFKKIDEHRMDWERKLDAKERAQLAMYDDDSDRIVSPSVSVTSEPSAIQSNVGLSPSDGFEIRNTVLAFDYTTMTSPEYDVEKEKTQEGDRRQEVVELEQRQPRIVPEEPAHSDLLSLHKDLILIQKRHVELMEEDMRWKWEMLAVLKQKYAQEEEKETKKSHEL